MPSTINKVAHGLLANATFTFANVLPTDSGIVEGTVYYVLASGLTANTFQFALTAGGTAITLTNAIASGDVYAVDEYGVTTDPIMPVPSTPTTPAAGVLGSAVVGLLVRLTFTLSDPATVPHVRLYEVMFTRDFAVTPTWTTATVYGIPEGTDAVVINALPLTTYYARVRSQDVYGQYSAWSAYVTHTTVDGADSYHTRNIAETVYINESGITILDGSLTFEDKFGTTVLTGAGFGRPWLAYLFYGFYNAIFEHATTNTEIAVSEVGSANTIADYAASLSTELPYWIVAAPGDANLSGTSLGGATAGRVLVSNSASGAKLNRIFQDIPVFPGKRRSLYVRYYADIVSGSADMRIYMSYRDINHAIVGTYDTLDTVALVDGGSFVTGIFDTGTLAPTQAAYVRFEIEARHNSGNNTLFIDAVYSPEDTDLDLATLTVDSIDTTATELLITGPTSHVGDLTLSGILYHANNHMRIGGTAFPIDPLNNDVFYRTDHDMFFRYDGTRWTCTCPHSTPFAMTTTTTLPVTATASNRWHAVLPTAPGLDLLVTDYDCSFLIVSGGTALSALHKWVLTLVTEPGGVTLSTLNIDAGASNTWRAVSDTGDDVVDVTAAQVAVAITATKTGTPGNLTFNAIMAYRYIGV